MANYLVVFESTVAYQVNAVEAALAQLGTPYLRILQTTWLVNSFLNIGRIFHIVSAVALPSDRFMVIEATDAMSDNLAVSADQFDGCWDSSHSTRYAR